MERLMVLDDGETFSPIAGCKIVDGHDTGNVLYAFTGDETGGVALTPALEEQVREALEEDAPQTILRSLLGDLARACDIEHDREEP